MKLFATALLISQTSAQDKRQSCQQIFDDIFSRNNNGTDLLPLLQDVGREAENIYTCSVSVSTIISESDSDDDLFNIEINDINELSDTSNPPAVSE